MLNALVGIFRHILGYRDTCTEMLNHFLAKLSPEGWCDQKCPKCAKHGAACSPSFSGLPDDIRASVFSWLTVTEGIKMKRLENEVRALADFSYL